MRQVIRAVQFLGDPRQEPQTGTSLYGNRDYLRLLENLFPTLADGVPVLLESPSFSAFIRTAVGRDPEILAMTTRTELEQYFAANDGQFRCSQYGGSITNPDEANAFFFALTNDQRHFLTNRLALEGFEELHRRFLSEVRGDHVFRTGPTVP